MIAPSEKHLEDWIVAHPEQALTEHVRIIRRQLQLPSGIADLVYRHVNNTLNVVELKKGAINADCVAQVLRYMGDLQGIYECVLTGMVQRNSLSWCDFTRAFTTVNCHIGGVLIGRGYADKHIPVICEAANIMLISYDFDIQSGYSFEGVSSPSFRLREPEYSRYYDPALILAFKEIAFFCADAYESMTENS